MFGNRAIEPSDFDGTPLRQLRAWAQDGSPDSMYRHSDRWQEENDYLSALVEEIKAKLAEAGAVLESASGEEMQNALNPVVLWTEATAETAKAHSLRMLEQGEAFAKLQRQVPGAAEEQDPPDTHWLKNESWSSLGDGASDTEPARVHNEQQRQQAVAAYEAYDKTSRQHVADSPLFTPPPGSEDETKERDRDGEPPSETTRSAWAGGGGGGGAVVAGGGATPGSGGGADRPLPPGGFAGIGSGGPTAGGGTGSSQPTAPRGPAGMAGAGMAGRPATRDSDDELDHETPDYLVADRGIFDDDMPKTAPPVFE
ncbi:hypothetical protein LZ318_40085 [Saccharopolyspora indica]|uniref:hypothetical protein n=1 Tax=Saccharopolyspora indica TaxID=1229659 RepID=UPI0022EB0B48|nr:hypothetical protein [Saccharopolyspora indica]MDA3650190.1 hypothetical protein [Saccharopolyspora indica]